MSLAIVLFHSPHCGYCRMIKGEGGGWPPMQADERLKSLDMREVDVQQLPRPPALLQGRGVPQIHLVRLGGRQPPVSLMSHLGSFSAQDKEPVVRKFVDAIETAKRPRRRAAERARGVSK